MEGSLPSSCSIPYVLIFASTAPSHPEAPCSPVAAEGHLFLQATLKITDPPS